MKRRLGLALVTSLAMLLATGVAAFAGYDFCSGDPVLNIEGAHVTVGVTAVKGSSVQVDVSVPQGVDVSVVTITGQLNETVSINHTNGVWSGSGDIPVQISATASQGGPVRVNVAGRGTHGRVSSSGDGSASVDFVVQPSSH